MATTDQHEAVASNASSVADSPPADGDTTTDVPTDTMNAQEQPEAKYDDGAQDSMPEDDDHDNAPVCGCIPHLWKGTIFGIVDYHVNPTVMIASVIIIWTFVIWCGADPKARDSMNIVNDFANYYFGWFYVAALITFASFAVFLVFSRFGDIKLGKPGKEPKYSVLTWFSMLFSAGVGVGLYFFGVSEPISHFLAAEGGGNRWSNGQFNTAAQDAINISWFHWGFTASAVYCVAALPLAYHHHVKGRPLRESTCFEPLIGKKYANGMIGQLIDIASVIGTMFGVATSLGLGVLQINAGLFFIFDVEETKEAQLAIIWVITAFAAVSVFTGLDAGIRRLSEVNFAFSFILLAFLFYAGEPIYLLNLFIQSVGYHIQWFFDLTFSLQAFEQEGFYDEMDGQTSSNEYFMGWWTIFYWAWWIAWAPFVGIFIAQISEGRTVREFIIGNMMVPTLFTCIWLTIFGGVGLWNEMASTMSGVECYTADPTGTNTTILFSDWQPEDVMGTWTAHTPGGNGVAKDTIMLSCFSGTHQLFALLYALPLPTFMSILALVGIVTYFVTSSDSASHVIDVLTANGNDEPPKMQRVFWALSEGAVASVLLTAGENTEDSLKALQTVSLIGAIPFTFVLLGEVLATYKTFQIHLGELDVTKLVYWKYDIIEAFYQDMATFAIATVCPPWVQYQARMKMVEHNERRKETSDYDPSYAPGAFQWVWVVGYFALYLMVIIFGLLEFAESGFKYLALAMHMFWVALSVGNRSLMKSYYGIDSSNIMFDLLSWTFCWCYAGTQEVLQAREGEVVRDLKVADTATPAKPVVDQKIELASAGDEAAPASDYVQ